MKKFAIILLMACASLSAAHAAGPDFEQALALLKKGEFAAAAGIIKPLAEQGEVKAKKELAKLLFYGTGVAKDQQQAYRLFQEVLLVSKDKEASYYTALLLINGGAGQKDDKRAVELLEYAATAGDDDPGIDRAQFLYAMACKNNYQYDNFRYYMELAAEQGMYEAWMELGKYYAERKGWTSTNLHWAKYCFDAAMRIKPDAEAEYRAGMVAAELRDFKRSFQLLQSAREKGSEKADNYLESGKLAKAERNWSYFLTNQHRWPKTSAALLDTPAARMLFIPAAMEKYPANWHFTTNRERLNCDSAFSDDIFGSGKRFWISDDFIAAPVRKNLCNMDTALLMLNEKYYPGFLEFMENSAFPECSGAEREALISFLRFGRPHLLAKDFAADHFRKLREDLYFHIHVKNGVGSKYQFITAKDGEYSLFFTFDVPPDKVDAAMIYGALADEHDALNNLAVELIRAHGKNGTGEIRRAEAMLRTLVDKKHPVGTYNFAVYLQNLGKSSEAEKYFAMAEKLTGSTVISYHIQRPEIFDRNGRLLVKNRFFLPNRQRSRSRVYDLPNGCFLPNLTGFVSVSSMERQQGSIARDAEYAIGGIEDIIERMNICQPVWLTVDYALQAQLNSLIRELASADPLYVSAVLVASDGELIAASQTPAMDVIKRNYSRLSPSALKYLDAFIPAAYLFPVPDQWMKLLGSSSYDIPENKARFKFHIKQNNFPAETAGLVPGLNCRLNEDRSTLSGQSANMLAFLCAYIGTAEKKDIPDVKYFTLQSNSPVAVKDTVRWISFYRPPDGIVVNALGSVKSTSGKNLYLMVRFVPMERQYGKKVPEKEIKKAADKSDRAEKIIRNFKFICNGVKK
ncbi:MAG: sel1 repeat family protein [Lentisphaerae bacterium]|nr:sel1 repeat family protein [Lentisphaerota bacterium]